MRVLFDGYWWTNGPAANRSVQRELIQAWSTHFPDDDIAVSTRRRTPADDLPPRAQQLQTTLWPHALSNFTELGMLARRWSADVIIPHNFTPLLGNAATFIHDVMFVEHPEWFSKKERAYFAAMIPTTRWSDLVVTSSETEAARIRSHLRGRHADVVPVGLGAPRAIADATPRKPAVADDLDAFALTVGRLNVRKNLGAVIGAAAASPLITPRSPLIVVGSSEHSGREADLPQEIESLRRAGRVIFAGRLADDELAWLYAHCSVSISLSRDEGFGLTPVEAVYWNAPLVVSDIAVHRETVGDLARLVPLDASAEVAAEALAEAWGSRPDPKMRHDVMNRCEWGAVVHRYREAVVRRLPRTM